MLTTKEGEASSSNNNGSYCENGHGHRGKNQDVAIAAPEVKKGKTFLDLPFEIRERILIFAHEMTLKERPGCIATVTNKPRRFSPGLLARSGEWGPVFQIIYANKQLHEEAIRIRYREIYIKAGYSSNAGPWVPMPDDSIMLDRLQSKAIQDYTKYAVIEIFHPQPTSATNQLIEVLGKMKSLKHLCLAVREATSSPYNLWDDNCHSRDFDILKFFGLNLNLETLTIQRVFCTNVNYPYEIDFHSYEKVAQAQNIFFYFAYKRSRWYKDPENKNKVFVQFRFQWWKDCLTGPFNRSLLDRFPSRFAIRLVAWTSIPSNYRTQTILHSAPSGISDP